MRLILANSLPEKTLLPSYYLPVNTAPSHVHARDISHTLALSLRWCSCCAVAEEPILALASALAPGKLILTASAAAVGLSRPH